MLPVHTRPLNYRKNHLLTTPPVAGLLLPACGALQNDLGVFEGHDVALNAIGVDLQTSLDVSQERVLFFQRPNRRVLEADSMRVAGLEFDQGGPSDFVDAE